MAMIHDIGSVDQIPPGEGRNFQIGGVKIAVFRTREGAIYATQPDCPHKQGPLADGLLGGTTVICPLHERAFELTTGQEIGADCRLRVYGATLTVARTVEIMIEEGFD